MAAKYKPNELYIERIYDAPVKAVWDAWTDPKQAAKWWGPRGFTITTHEKDLRPGGIWHYTMHGPDGVDYPNKTKYYTVDQYSKLVYDHGGNDEREPLFQVTVTFEEKKGKTKMCMTMAFKSEDAAREAKKFIKIASGNSTWDRLAEYLEKESSGKEKFVINRTFHAPIDRVFEAWTKIEHFKNWMGPTGSTMIVTKGEIAEGKSLYYKMNHPAGMDLFGLVKYIKIEKPTHLLYSQSFIDENEKIVPPPFSATWPHTMITDVKFVDEGDGETRITLTWAPYPEATAAEIATFVEGRTGMTQGWTGSFDKLEEIL